MSLIRVRRIEDVVELPGIDEAVNEFKASYVDYINKSDKEHLADMVKDYSNVSYLYLKELAQTLESNDKIKNTMTYMNSIIAEACSETQITYFHKNEGYSIIDKAVAYVIDNGYQYDCIFVLGIIDDMLKAIEEEAKIEKVIDKAFENVKTKKKG